MKHESHAKNSAVPGQVITARPSLFVYILYGIGLLFFVAMGIIAAFAFSYVIKKNYSLIQPIGEGSVVLIAFLEYWVLSRFPLWTATDGRTVSTISVRGKRTIVLSDIIKMTRVTCIIGRNVTGIYCIKCRTTDGATIFLQLGCLSSEQRTLLFAPLVHGLKASQADIPLSVKYLWQQWYNYSGAPTDPDFPGEVPESMTNREGIIFIVALNIMFLCAVGATAYVRHLQPIDNQATIPETVQTVQAPTPSVSPQEILKQASPVANQYVADLAAGNTATVTAVESPKLQTNVEHQQFIATYRPSSATALRLIDSQAGYINSNQDAAFVFEDAGDNSGYYLKIALTKHDGVWRVYFFQTAYRKLNASS